MQKIKRRELLKLGLAGAGTLCLPWRSNVKADAAGNDDPHFFLQVILNTGADTSYWFDARPLALTAAGKIQNYNGADPTPWVGSNGNQCLVTAATTPLLPYRNSFSIINGVVMEASFDGHLQNMNTLLTGNAFGGEFFVPHLNSNDLGRTATAFDGIQNGFAPSDLSNVGGIVPLNAESTGALKDSLIYLPNTTSSDPLLEFIHGRLVANGVGSGRFAEGARQMEKSWYSAGEVQKKLLRLPPPNSAETADEAFISLISSLFRESMTRSAVWVFPELFDTHAAADAKKQPKMFADVIERIALIFRKLSNTPYDATRSLLDVTTIFISSEFGRTMRTNRAPIDNTGTDHNPLSNTVLIGGKGIRGGQVIGSSDFATATESLSGAHLTMDAEMIKTMGRPFDFTSGTSRSDRPAAFSLTDYLTIGSVINSIYTAFNVPSARHRTYSRTLPQKIPLVRQLLA